MTAAERVRAFFRVRRAWTRPQLVKLVGQNAAVYDALEAMEDCGEVQAKKEICPHCGHPHTRYYREE